MSTNYHTVIANGAAANASIINAPLAQLDAALVSQAATITALQNSVILGGAAVTLTNGAANAAQKVVTVDSSAQFVAGCYVEYALVGGVLERNTVDTVDSGTQITLITNIGTGGIANDSPVAVIPAGFYNAGKGIYNVLDYGAVGDNSTDDSAAIQAAIDAAETGSTGAIVYFPVGTYHIHTGLTVTAANIILSGEPGGLSQITMTGAGGSVLTITGHACVVRYLYITTSDHANAGHGIYLNGAYGARLLDVTTYNVQYHGVYAVSAYSMYTANCVFSAAGADATYAGFCHGTDSNNVVHMRSRFYGSTDRTGCKVLAGTQIAFIGCDFSGGAAGTSTGLDVVFAYALSVKDCYFESNGGYAIHIGSGASQPVGVMIEGCWINQNDIAGNVGIQISKARNCRIENNILVGNSTGSESGIVVASDDQTVTFLYIGSSNLIDGVATTISDTRKRADSHFEQRVKYATAVVTDGSYYAKGAIIWNSDPAAGEYAGWICVSNGAAAKGYWVTGHAYTTGDYVVALNYGKVYRATTTGTAGSTEPSHDSGTASDGAVTWQYIAGSQDLASFKGFGSINFGVENTTNALTYGLIINESGADANTRIEGDNDENLLMTDADVDAVGIGIAAPLAKLHVDQSSTSGAKPVLTVDQADVSEEFIHFIGESTTDNSQSLIDAADLEDPGAIAGWLKIKITDVQATNPITDGIYWIPFYATPTHSA